MAKQRIDRSFVSELDQFISEFDQKHPEKSASQIKNINKHNRISQLRDHALDPDVASAKLWEKFMNEGEYTG